MCERNAGGDECEARLREPTGKQPANQLGKYHRSQTCGFVLEFHWWKLSAVAVADWTGGRCDTESEKGASTVRTVAVADWTGGRCDLWDNCPHPSLTSRPRARLLRKGITTGNTPSQLARACEAATSERHRYGCD